MKRIVLLIGAIGIAVPYLNAVRPSTLKQKAADYVLDNVLKEQDPQKVKSMLEQLPKEVRDYVKERIIKRYRLPLFSALSLKTIPAKTVVPFTFGVCPIGFSSDGRYALTGYDSYGVSNPRYKVIHWDLTTGSIREFQGHTDRITSGAFSKNGEYALTGSGDNTARLWDLSTGQTIREFRHTDMVTSVALSSDGRYALTGSFDNTARLWDMANVAAEPKVLQGHTRAVNSVALSADGRYALTGSNDHTARLWDLSTGQTIRELKGHTSWVLSVALSKYGRYALTSSLDNTVRLWDLETGQTIRTLQGHTDWINSVAFSSDGKYALTGSADKTAYLWDIATPLAEPLILRHGSNFDITSVAFSSDGKYALTGSDGNMACLWDLEHSIKDLDLEQLIALLTVPKPTQ